ncbi:MAG: O-antigen ligase family protein [Acidobacteria bacterium]|nr:O-antigen ligase family protein [Acidobacteriota bacterium]
MSTALSAEVRPRIAASDLRASRAQRLLWLLAAAAIGLAALAGVVALEGKDYKLWVVTIAAVVSLPICVVMRRPRLILLFGWVFALSYNRQYFVFESIVGYQGTSGPYVILSDLCFAGLLGLWLIERIRRCPEQPAGGRSFWPWFLPFAIASFLSVFVAQRVDWALFEMIRIVKMGILLVYIGRNFGRAEWMTCLLALSLAMAFQSMIAIKEVAMQKQGVIGAQDLGAEAGEEDLASHFEGGKFYGMIRGVGTLAHPPYLACFLLLGMPPLFGLALTARRGRAALAALAFLLACGGLICTMSRWPWFMALLEIILVVVALAGMRLLAVKQALGLTVLSLFIGGLAAIPFQQKILDRMKGDFDESVQYRKDGFRASLAAISDQPLLGMGLNNTKLYFHRYLPVFDWAFSTEDFATHLVLCLGLVAGMIGALGEQIIDTPLWVDPNLYIFTLFAGMLCIAPQLFAGRGALEQEA